MEIELTRTYYTKGTNGVIHINEQFNCYTIELPWKFNMPKVSCIPEGKYELKPRYSEKFKHHLIVIGVQNREDILIHPANNALLELKGCIAPVTILTAPGEGSESRKALEQLRAIVYKAIESETIYLNIKSTNYEYYTKSTGTDTRFF